MDLNIFAEVSLALLVAVFVSTGIKAYFMRKTDVDEFSRLPLEDSRHN